jgi:hypothetical protein
MVYTLGILAILLITYALIVMEERFNDGHR